MSLIFKDFSCQTISSDGNCKEIVLCGKITGKLLKPVAFSI